jgi:hypothetical protein
MTSRPMTAFLTAITLVWVVGCASQPQPAQTSSPSAAEHTERSPKEPATIADDEAGSQTAPSEDLAPSRSSGTPGPADETEPTPTDPGETAVSHGGAPPDGPATADERAAELEGELDRSLEEFDGVLLEEQRRLDHASGEAGNASGGDASEGVPGGGEASSPGAGPAGDSPSAGSRNDAGGSEMRGASPGEAGDSSGAVGGGDADGPRRDPRVPPDVGDGSDDDIIARQLREAATAEDDPELRARLWDEYRAYKDSISSASGEDD